MDLLIYCLLLFVLGTIRVNKTRNVSELDGIVATTGTTTAECSLPVAENFHLIKEQGAYTLILMELGLIRC